MPRYRVYLSSRGGEAEPFAALEFDDDQAAIAHGLSVDRGGRSLEIWCDLRLVALLAPLTSVSPAVGRRLLDGAVQPPRAVARTD